MSDSNLHPVMRGVFAAHMPEADQGSARELSPSASGPKSGLLPSEVLARAADLITAPGAWTQFALAAETPLRDEAEGDEEGLYEHHPDARCWCAMGAIGRVVPDISDGSVLDAKRSAYRFLRDAVGSAIPNFNDDPARTQAEVVTALRKASELAKAEGQ